MEARHDVEAALRILVHPFSLRARPLMRSERRGRRRRRCAISHFFPLTVRRDRSVR